MTREAKRAQFAQEAEGRSNKNAVRILAPVALAGLYARTTTVKGYDQALITEEL
jgi:hypothetical protein